MKITLKVICALLVLFFSFGFYKSSTPEGKEKASERASIDYCWGSHEKKSNSYGQQRFIASACEKMEADFLTKWGVKP